MKRLHVAAGLLLLAPELAGQRLLLATLPLEAVVIALVERELAAFEMKDRAGDGVEEIAVVADDHHGCRISADVGFSARSPLRGRDSCSARRAAAHRARQTAPPPAPPACASRPTAPSRADRSDRRRSRGPPGSAPPAPAPNARRCRPAASGCRRCGRDPSHGRPPREGRALEVGRQHGIDQAPFAGRCFLRHRADAGMARHADRAGIRHRVAEDQPQQRRLADAVAADEPHLVPARMTALAASRIRRPSMR